MLKSMKLTALLTIALAATVQSACERAPAITSPDTIVQAESAPLASGFRATQTVRFRSGVSEVQSVEGVLSSGGGSLALVHAGNPIVVLTVHGGTVPGQRAHFRMSLEPLSNGAYQVTLTATSPGSTTVNDIGSRGFRKPVQLSFNTAYLETEGIAINRLGVAEYRDGELIPVASHMDRRTGWLTGILNHFSGYVPISD